MGATGSESQQRNSANQGGQTGEVKNARAGPNQDTPCARPNREHKTTQPDRATLNREAQGRGGRGTGREEGSRGREDRKSDHHTGGEQGSAKGHEAKKRQARTIGK